MHRVWDRIRKVNSENESFGPKDVVSSSESAHGSEVGSKLVSALRPDKSLVDHDCSSFNSWTFPPRLIAVGHHGRN